MISQAGCGARAEAAQFGEVSTRLAEVCRDICPSSNTFDCGQRTQLDPVTDIFSSKDEPVEGRATPAAIGREWSHQSGRDLTLIS
jgi:hypothetical protein